MQKKTVLMRVFEDSRAVFKHLAIDHNMTVPEAVELFLKGKKK